MTAAVANAKTKESKHEEIFIARYDRLLKWAAHLTKPNRDLANDIVQEAFVQFTSRAGISLILITSIIISSVWCAILISLILGKLLDSSTSRWKTMNSIPRLVRS